MPLQLSLALPEDLPEIVKHQFAAFHPNDTMHVLIYPSPDPPTEEVIEKTAKRQLKYWEEDKEHITWIKVTDTSTNEIVAAAKWIMWPSPDLPTWPAKMSATWLADTDPKGVNAGNGVDDKAYVEWVLEQFFGRRRERVTEPCALLDICFTSPMYHRRGAGKMLVKWGTERADELGLKSFVEASFMGRGLYERCGFKVGETVRLERGYGVVEYYWMEREARGVPN